MLSDREKILKIWRESADLDPWTLPGPYWQWHLSDSYVCSVQLWINSIGHKLLFHLVASKEAILIHESSILLTGCFRRNNSS